MDKIDFLHKYQDKIQDTNIMDFLLNNKKPLLKPGFDTIYPEFNRDIENINFDIEDFNKKSNMSKFEKEMETIQSILLGAFPTVESIKYLIEDECVSGRPYNIKRFYLDKDKDDLYNLLKSKCPFFNGKIGFLSYTTSKEITTMFIGVNMESPNGIVDNCYIADPSQIKNFSGLLKDTIIDTNVGERCYIKNSVILGRSTSINLAVVQDSYIRLIGPISNTHQIIHSYIIGTNKEVTSESDIVYRILTGTLGQKEYIYKGGIISFNLGGYQCLPDTVWFGELIAHEYKPEYIVFQEETGAKSNNGNTVLGCLYSQYKVELEEIKPIYRKINYSEYDIIYKSKKIHLYNVHAPAYKNNANAVVFKGDEIDNLVDSISPTIIIGDFNFNTILQKRNQCDNKKLEGAISSHTLIFAEYMKLTNVFGDAHYLLQIDVDYS